MTGIISIYTCTPTGSFYIYSLIIVLAYVDTHPYHITLCLSLCLNKATQLASTLTLLQIYNMAMPRICLYSSQYRLLTKILLMFFRRSMTLFMTLRGGRYILTSNSEILGSAYSSHRRLGIIFIGISCITVRLFELSDGWNYMCTCYSPHNYCLDDHSLLSLSLENRSRRNDQLSIWMDKWIAPYMRSCALPTKFLIFICYW